MRRLPWTVPCEGSLKASALFCVSGEDEKSKAPKSGKLRCCPVQDQVSFINGEIWLWELSLERAVGDEVKESSRRHQERKAEHACFQKSSDLKQP